jgi:hypothetical protein
MDDVIWLDDIPIEPTPPGEHPPDRGDCDCGCPYQGMSEADKLPLITAITDHFPDEWLAFIVPPEEDDDPLPLHGKLVAHSSSLDEVQDALLTVLWNQCVYVFYNGDVEAQQASL